MGDRRLRVQSSASRTAMFAGPEIVQAPPQQLQAVHVDRATSSTRCRPTFARSPTRTSSACRRRRARWFARRRWRARSRRRCRRATSPISRASIASKASRSATGCRSSSAAASSANVRARYGLDDQQAKGAAAIVVDAAERVGVRALCVARFPRCGRRRRAVDDRQQSRGAGVRKRLHAIRISSALSERAADYVAANGIRSRLTASYEWQSPLSVRAGTGVRRLRADGSGGSDRTRSRVSLEVDRPPTLSLSRHRVGDPRPTARDVRIRQPTRRYLGSAERRRTLRGAIEREHRAAIWRESLGDHDDARVCRVAVPTERHRRRSSSTSAGRSPAPGYDYHSLVVDARHSASTSSGACRRRSFRFRSDASACARPRHVRAVSCMSIGATRRRSCITDGRLDAAIRLGGCRLPHAVRSPALRCRARASQRALDVLRRREPRVLERVCSRCVGLRRRAMRQ